MPVLYAGMRSPEQRIARFKSKLSRSGDCLLWKGSKREDGYGVVSWKTSERERSISFYVHRVAWVIENQRDIPEGMVIDQTCGNKACCEPTHLECVTQTVNVERYHQRKESAGFCKYGHSREIGTICKQCNRDRQREWAERNPDRRREQQRRYDAKRVWDPVAKKMRLSG